jgi:hypothetical protein
MHKMQLQVIFGLVVLYTMLYGCLPFAESKEDIIYRKNLSHNLLLFFVKR